MRIPKIPFLNGKEREAGGESEFSLTPEERLVVDQFNGALESEVPWKDAIGIITEGIADLGRRKEVEEHIRQERMANVIAQRKDISKL